MRICCCWITGRTYWQNDIPLKDGTTKTFKTVQIWMNLQSRKVYTFNTWHNNIHFCPQQNGVEKGMFLMSFTQFKNPRILRLYEEDTWKRWIRATHCLSVVNEKKFSSYIGCFWNIPRISELCSCINKESHKILQQRTVKIWGSFYY